MFLALDIFEFNVTHVFFQLEPLKAKNKQNHDTCKGEWHIFTSGSAFFVDK